MPVAGLATTQGEVKVMDPSDAQTQKWEEAKGLAAEQKKPAEETAKKDDDRMLEATVTAAYYTKLSGIVALFALVLTFIFSVVQIVIVVWQLVPTLKSLDVQATITRLDQVKRRLDSLCGGPIKITEESLFVFDHEPTDAKDHRIKHIANQLCDAGDAKRRAAVEKLIRQWFELEEKLDN